MKASLEFDRKVELKQRTPREPDERQLSPVGFYYGTADREPLFNALPPSWFKKWFEDAVGQLGLIPVRNLVTWNQNAF